MTIVPLSQTSAILISQIWKPPDAAETNSVAETGEDELCGAAPLPTLAVVIVLHCRDVLKQVHRDVTVSQRPVPEGYNVLFYAQLIVSKVALERWLQVCL